ncbi:leucyl aminopeptidase [Marinicella sp. S1101]|uniref:leucyl aminopeptidase n=1 Tax=Marinicella marina TaxID=2996016 RepID=UPI002261042C|nr:leucyl aminopeptidase [Marinicella marina]MCX7552617.1 leucyl aminopeptidase [Marinicella marina]MDJ1139493.1 leucyl aminopeptidase [Marinicella marina]
MKLKATHKSIDTSQADQVLITHYKDQDKNDMIEQLGSEIQSQFADRIKNQDLTGKAGESVNLYASNGQIVTVIGMGKADKITATALYEATHKATQAAAKSRVETLANFMAPNGCGDVDAEQATKLITLASAHGEYRYEDTKSFKKGNKHKLKAIEVAVNDDQATAFEQAKAMASGVSAARHLGNNPPNICTPAYIADYASKFAAKNDSCEINVLNHKQMKKMGMGALMAVGQGSANKPKMVVLKYNGGNKDDAPIALVGKGITFDTGGISLKPGPNMDEMKYDMCGAATVIGGFVAAVELGLPINLLTFVPAVENMPDGKAYRPGDVITSYSGKTIEVLNTDAEGRMILCDTLTYAQEFKPSVILDFATLTGACVVALGHQASAVMTKTDGLYDDLKQAGLQAHDRVWELPLWDEYQKQIDTTFADMQNIGGFPAGTITAGCFLSRFTDGQKWAHVDIAGTAWNSKKEGATGRPVAMLVQYLINESQK